MGKEAGNRESVTPGELLCGPKSTEGGLVGLLLANRLSRRENRL